jgi:Uma2 family endonuclease
MSTVTLPSPRFTGLGGRSTVADLLHDLGDIPPSRVRLVPTPGTATFDDLIAVNELKSAPLCEMVDGTLVEKAMGHFEGWVTFIILGYFDRYLEANDIGMVYTPDAVLKILPDIGRAADVAFVSWTSLPGGRPPARSDAVPEVVPDLAIEVLSRSNTPAEMTRKRGEYFRAGVKLVWEIDPETRGAKAYASPTAVAEVPPNGILDAGGVMPGFQLSLQAVFDRAERRPSHP